MKPNQERFAAAAEHFISELKGWSILKRKSYGYDFIAFDEKKKRLHFIELYGVVSNEGEVSFPEENVDLSKEGRAAFEKVALSFLAQQGENLPSCMFFLSTISVVQIADDKAAIRLHQIEF